MESYRNPDFVRDHAIKIIEFYKPLVRDKENGGYYCAYLDDGEVYDKNIKDLISTTRFILNFCFGIFLGGSEEYKDYIRHGLEFLEIIHRDDINGGYHQVANGITPVIGNKMTYGQAFCLCAASNAYRAGVKEAYPLISRIYDFMENKLWNEENSLYVDECSNDFEKIEPYRGQNSNMHMTEAMLAAYEATNEIRYLDRAYKLAYKIVVDLAKQSKGMVWEHYKTNWVIDWEYNKDDPRNLYRPYGFLAGHFTEWSKLLLILERYKPADWQLEVAEFLFNKAMELAWDSENGGINYTFDLDGNILDDERYYWTHAETLAASASLALRTGNEDYWEKYKECWEYPERYFVDKKYGGGWYRVLSREGEPLSDKKSPPGKSDYHVIGACYEIVRSMEHYGIS
jgi:mannose/cellobiose epimerase-like protein (N-acyl-D-glucosamine 2-epimerase family)